MLTPAAGVASTKSRGCHFLDGDAAAARMRSRGPLPPARRRPVPPRRPVAATPADPEPRARSGHDVSPGRRRRLRAADRPGGIERGIDADALGRRRAMRPGRLRPWVDQGRRARGVSPTTRHGTGCASARWPTRHLRGARPTSRPGQRHGVRRPRLAAATSVRALLAETPRPHRGVSKPSPGHRRHQRGADFTLAAPRPSSSASAARAVPVAGCAPGRRLRDEHGLVASASLGARCWIWREGFGATPGAGLVPAVLSA